VRQISGGLYAAAGFIRGLRYGFAGGAGSGVSNTSIVASGSVMGETSGSVLGGSFFEIVFILIVFVCILFLAYVVTRFVAGRASGRLKSRHIEVADTLSVGTDAQLLIVKVGGEYFLVSKSQKQFAFLTKLELTSGDMEEAAVQTTGFAGSFRSVLEGKLGLPQLSRKTAGGQPDGKAEAEGQPDMRPGRRSDGAGGGQPRHDHRRHGANGHAAQAGRKSCGYA
jgi:flagellar protein FliO/FliZ